MSASITIFFPLAIVHHLRTSFFNCKSFLQIHQIGFCIFFPHNVIVCVFSMCPEALKEMFQMETAFSDLTDIHIPPIFKCLDLFFLLLPITL